jgi:CheY-like chemotaxis protein/HPt (histidine-containing phosphotransfer) domain-containing protein
MGQQAEKRVPEEEETPTVLLVEDNLFNQKAEMILLQQLGLTAEIANNGKEAVAAVSRYRYALILMDCHMPEMDGFEATVAIRKLESMTGRYTPIVAVTALAMSGDRERCIAAGMDDYISKPIDKDMLRIKINHWLKKEVVYESHKLARKYLRPHCDLVLLDSAPINLRDLEEFYGDHTNEMVDLFIANSEHMLRLLDSYLPERNSRSVAYLAHELKASCASIGAKQLARLCLYLEQAVGQDDWVEAKETVDSFKKSFAYIKDYIVSAAERTTDDFLPAS